MKVSRRIIAEAFMYFERFGFKRPNIPNFESLPQDHQKATEWRKRYEEACENDWLELFSGVDASIFGVACKEVVKSVKYWPRPADMFSVFDRLKDEALAKLPALPPAPVKRDMSADRIEKIMEALRSGRAQEWLKDNISQEIKDYARSLYPDISDDLIIKNYSEFSQLRDNPNLAGWLDKKNGYIKLSRVGS